MSQEDSSTAVPLPRPPESSTSSTSANQLFRRFPAQDVLLGYGKIRRYPQIGNLILKEMARSEQFPQRTEVLNTDGLRAVKRILHQGVERCLGPGFPEPKFWILADPVLADSHADSGWWKVQGPPIC